MCSLFHCECSTARHEDNIFLQSLRDSNDDDDDDDEVKAN